MAFARTATGALAVALGALALFAGNAPADVLCKTEPQIVKGVETCLNPYPTEYELHGSTESALLEAGSYATECGSTLAIDVVEDLGAGKGLAVEITKMTFFGCAGSCAAAKALGLPYPSTLSATGGGDGLILYDSALSLQLIDCTVLKLDYVYDSGSKFEPTLDRGAPYPYSVPGKTPLKPSGECGLCPETGLFSFDYLGEIPEEGQLFVSSH